MPTTDITDPTGEFLKLDAEIKKLKSENKALTAEVNKALARSHVMAAGLAAGVHPDCIEDLVSRGDKAGWAMKNGHAVMIGADGVSHSEIGPAEWVKSLKKTAGHLFGQQEDPVQYAPLGTTAQPTSGGGGQDLKPGEKNPFSDQHWNDTAQALLINADRPRADRLAAAAGTFVGAMPPDMRKKTPY